MPNNYDQSSTGINIECNCFNDCDVARFYFDESFNVIQSPSYQKTGIYYFTENGNVEGADKITFTVEGSEDAIRTHAIEHCYAPEEETLETMKILIVESYEVTLATFETENAYLSRTEKGFQFAPSKPLTKLITRGYCQGDYAVVYYSADDIAAAWGNAPDAAELRTLIDHLFWDQPINASATINGETYSYSDCPSYDEYEWNRADFIKWVAGEAAIPPEMLDAVMPKEPTEG